MDAYRDLCGGALTNMLGDGKLASKRGDMNSFSPT